MGVLTVCAELALRTGTRLLEPAAVEQACAATGIRQGDWVAELARLRDRGLVQLQTCPPARVLLLAITDDGLDEHLRAVRPDLDDVERRLAAAARSAQGGGPVDLAAEVGEPPLLVECILERWVRGRRIVYSKAPGRRFRVHRVLDVRLPGAAAASAEPPAG